MKKTTRFIAVLALFSCGILLLFTACSTQVDDPLAVVQVEIELPELVAVGEEIELKAHITYGKERVSDAEEVQFEVWPEDRKDESVWIDAELLEAGVYGIHHVFEEAGAYRVQSHVTAKDMHVMPIQRLEVE